MRGKRRKTGVKKQRELEFLVSFEFIQRLSCQVLMGNPVKHLHFYVMFPRSEKCLDLDTVLETACNGNRITFGINLYLTK